MALADKGYTRMYSTTGSDADLLDNSKITKMEAEFTNNEYLQDEAKFEQQGMLIVQIQKLMDELDEIRRHVLNDIVGTQGPKGDTGAAGANGAAGAKGDKGDKGDTGATGPAGTTDASQLDASKLPTSKPKTKNKLWNNRGVVNVS